jgi:hypothetical protein
MSIYSFLQIILGSIFSPTFVGVTTRTKVRMYVSGNPYRDFEIYKVSKRSGIINLDVSKLVNKRRKAAGLEPNWILEPRKWASFVLGSTIFHHKTYVNRFYFSFVQLSARTLHYEYSNGEKLTHEEVSAIKAFIIQPDYSAEISAQGLTSKTVVQERIFGIDSILSLRAEKKEWQPNDI